MYRLTLFITILLYPALSFANCEISNADPTNGDLVALLLPQTEQCPDNVFALKKVLENDGLQLNPYMVANRGSHNPKFGSFSVFEIASGTSTLTSLTLNDHQLYFGHFTGVEAGEVIFDQAPQRGKLMVELIAWDFSKKIYNFYELIGTSNSAKWFYRGNSLDALADNKNLHLQKDPSQPQFGNRMRCSGCHTSGGPIMKELSAPHNDWWNDTDGLEFWPNALSPQVSELVGTLKNASQFSQSVKAGIEDLNASDSYLQFKKNGSLKELLRPLFCTTEINLVSDSGESLDSLLISSAYFTSPFFVDTPLELSRNDYESVLEELNFQFPETTFRDAAHAWLTPVKGFADLAAIKTLISTQVIDQEFAGDVLFVDFTSPLFSQKRCELLKEVPNKFSADWLNIFKKNLAQSKKEGAKELLENLQDPAKNMVLYEEVAESYLSTKRKSLANSAEVKREIINLHNLRMAVFSSEISQNPRGQILEPGFRVIFPLPQP